MVVALTTFEGICPTLNTQHSITHRPECWSTEIANGAIMTSTCPVLFFVTCQIRLEYN